MKDGFKEDAESALTERLGAKWRAYSFASLYDQALTALTIEKKDSPTTYKGSQLVDIIKQERQRAERIDDYNEMLKRKANQAN